MKKRATVTPGTAPATMTVQEAVDYLRAHPSAIYRLIKQGQIPGFRIGRYWGFRR
jgi:excisionase family DNA binding protein